MVFRLKRGDQVQVIRGSENGKSGKVLRFISGAGEGMRTSDQVVVQGINLRYKHIKRSQKYPQGGRIQMEAPIDVSNVMLLEGDTPTRVKSGTDKNGKRIRVSVRTSKPI